MKKARADQLETSSWAACSTRARRQRLPMSSDGPSASSWGLAAAWLPPVPGASSSPCAAPVGLCRTAAGHGTWSTENLLRNRHDPGLRALPRPVDSLIH